MTKQKTKPVGPLWVKILHYVGAPVAEQLLTAQEVFYLTGQTYRRLFVRPWRWNEISTAIVQMAIGSIPIIGMCTAFAGLVITNEMAWHMDMALHTVTMIPGFSAQLIFRELGTAIPAFLLVAKVGAATTAEVGSMKVTEQIDALKLLGIDPISYLVFPRWIACIVSTACMTLFAIAVTLACALSVAIVRYNFSVLEYLNALRHFIGVKDLLVALAKGVTFGSVIPIISCAYGFRCRGGAEGVGSATTNSVVASTVTVIILDFILTYFSTWII